MKGGLTSKFAINANSIDFSSISDICIAKTLSLHSRPARTTIVDHTLRRSSMPSKRNVRRQLAKHSLESSWWESDQAAHCDPSSLFWHAQSLLVVSRASTYEWGANAERNLPKREPNGNYHRNDQHAHVTTAKPYLCRRKTARRALKHRQRFKIRLTTNSYPLQTTGRWG